jgi:hypothetical protein
MRRFRDSYGIVWLALIAFGLELVSAVSHGYHDHHPDLQSRALTAGLCAPAAAVCAPELPHKHSDDCVTCWAISVASLSVLPGGLISPEPLSHYVLSRASSARAFRLVSLPAQFRARAPPAFFFA